MRTLPSTPGLDFAGSPGSGAMPACGLCARAELASSVSTAARDTIGRSSLLVMLFVGRCRPGRLGCFLPDFFLPGFFLLPSPRDRPAARRFAKGGAASAERRIRAVGTGRQSALEDQ